jgi:phospholipid/cholesterol/gamma-HCH transport system substrate-binding protein
MNRDRNALKAGTFIVVSFVLTIAVVVAIKDFGRFAEPANLRSVRFKLTDDIGGLRVGDEVRLGGFKVGSIKSIDGVNVDGSGTERPGLVLVFTLPRKYVLREGASVAVQTSLTGAAVLNVTDLGNGQPVSDGVAVAGVPDPKSVLFTGLGEFTPRLNALTQRVQTETLPKVEDTVLQFKQTAATANDAVAHANSAVVTPAGEAVTKARDLIDEARPDVKGTLSNLNATTGTLKTRIPEVMDKVDSFLAKVQTAMDDVQKTLVDVQATMGNARDLSASARSIVVGNRTRIDAMVSGAKTASDNLKAATAEIRRSPWRLLYKPAKGEMANLNLYDAARQFAEGANDMNDAAGALRDALATKDVDEKQLRALVERLDKSFNSFLEVEKVLWARVRE